VLENCTRIWKMGNGWRKILFHISGYLIDHISIVNRRVQKQHTRDWANKIIATHFLIKLVSVQLKIKKIIPPKKARMHQTAINWIKSPLYFSLYIMLWIKIIFFSSSIKAVHGSIKRNFIEKTVGKVGNCYFCGKKFKNFS
jgi:hypothetical protein